MKSILLAAACAASLLLAGTTVTVAADNSASIPAQCASEETKAAHPAWYRDGGYCANHFIQTDHYIEPKCPW